MKPKPLLWGLPLLALVILSVVWLKLPAEDGVMHVYKTPTCGCCDDWVEQMREAGFNLRTENLNSLNEVKQRLGVAPSLGSCHTAVIEGYVIEGHVPAQDIRRLLLERPEITGLAVPGMPHGSPGMETGHFDAFAVIAFDHARDEWSIWSEYHQPQDWTAQEAP